MGDQLRRHMHGEHVVSDRFPFYQVPGASGVMEVHACIPGEPLPEGAVLLPRKPERGERFENGEFVVDHRHVADHAAGPRRIAEARERKAREALVVLVLGAKAKPVDVPWLAAEAEATGQTIEDVARQVRAKAAAADALAIAREVNRQLGQAGRLRDGGKAAEVAAVIINSKGQG